MALYKLKFSTLLLSVFVVCLGTYTDAAHSTNGHIVLNERLSQWWLRQQPQAVNVDPIFWTVESEKRIQRLRKNELLLSLKSHEQHMPDLYRWFESLPVTGRLHVGVSSPRLLEVKPELDPILKAGHQVRLLPKPQHVAVMVADQRICLIEHQHGALARDYLRACVDEVSYSQYPTFWMSQPDGAVNVVHTAPWNEQPNSMPKAGAWIWVPPSSWGLPYLVSESVADFLLTQEPFEFSLRSASLEVHHLSIPYVEGVRENKERGLVLSSNDFGELGLLQMPSARFAPESSVRFNLSVVPPYTRGTVMLQPFDWLEFGFKYTDISNRLYGPESLSGKQSYKDKSFDFKVRLAKESAYIPAVALGFRDFGGTGLFAGEYLVASKRWKKLDTSLGIGWGYLGSRGNISNPAAKLLGSRFESREVFRDSTGGTFNLGSYFSGRASLFGGFQYELTPSWLLKLEYDGNNYRFEPTNFSKYRPSSPMNWGLVYRSSPYVDWSLGVQRGNQVFAGLTIHTGPHPLSQIYAPKTQDLQIPTSLILGTQVNQEVDTKQLASEVARLLDWRVLSLDADGRHLRITAEATAAVYMQERIDRAVKLLHFRLPQSYGLITFQLSEVGMPLVNVQIDRHEWALRYVAAQPPSEQLQVQQILDVSVSRSLTPPSQTVPNAATYWTRPYYQQIVGGPDGFILYAFGLQALFDYRFGPGTWFWGAANWRFHDNYDKFKYDAPSNLPRVRTFQRQYITESSLTLAVAQLTHVEQLSSNHYLSVYGGMLEPMYGGFGAEWYFRPKASSLSYGVDVNRVRQREFKQGLGFRKYEVNTGHATLNWQTGFKGVEAKLMAGQYLAGDRGITIDMKRVFANGVSVGAYATFTTASKKEFGEGSFDKGVYVNIPFDVFLPRSAGGNIHLMYQPLFRDGGARLSRQFSLHDITRVRDPSLWRYRPAN
jgi:hypothetical protein